MSGFQVGDVVVCVDDSPSEGKGNVPVGTAFPIERGATHRIADIDARFGHWWVAFDPSPYADMYDALRFRKVCKADEQFREQLRTCKPARVGEPA